MPKNGLSSAKFTDQVERLACSYPGLRRWCHGYYGLVSGKLEVEHTSGIPAASSHVNPEGLCINILVDTTMYSA